MDDKLPVPPPAPTDLTLKQAGASERVSGGGAGRPRPLAGQPGQHFERPDGLGTVD